MWDLRVFKWQTAATGQPVWLWLTAFLIETVFPSLKPEWKALTERVSSGLIYTVNLTSIVPQYCIRVTRAISWLNWLFLPPSHIRSPMDSNGDLRSLLSQKIAIIPGFKSAYHLLALKVMLIPSHRWKRQKWWPRHYISFTWRIRFLQCARDQCGTEIFTGDSWQHWCLQGSDDTYWLS